MSAPARPRGRPKVKVILPDGRVVYGRQEAAQAMGYRKADPLLDRYGTQDKDGVWHIRHPDAPGVTVIAPGGKRYQGWPAAAAALGRNKTTIRRHSEKISPKTWQVSASIFEPKTTIVLPDGQVVHGWREASEISGHPIERLRWWSVCTGDRQWSVPAYGRPRRRRGWTNGAVKRRGE